MIGKVNRAITVKQLYDYALQHNYIDTDAKIVLDIIDRERNNVNIEHDRHNKHDNLVSPINNTSTIDFNNLVEYSTNDLLTLLSL